MKLRRQEGTAYGRVRLLTTDHAAKNLKGQRRGRARVLISFASTILLGKKYTDGSFFQVLKVS
jgi:hypothetical protein